MDEEVIDNVVENDPAVESEARQMGWVPEEDFRGDKSKWRSAEEFVERGREILPIVLKNKEELLVKNRVLEAELKEMKTAIEDFKEYRKADKDRMYKQALQDLKAKKKEAIADGDGELAVELDDAIDELKESAKDAPVTPVEKTDQLDPEFVKWVDETEWYRKDAALQHAANAAAIDVQAIFPQLKGRAFLDKVSDLVKDKYPEKFGNTRRTNSNTVEEGGNTQPRSTKKKSYDNLPADAKAACDKFVKQGIMSKEDYVNEYDW